MFSFIGVHPTKSNLHSTNNSSHFDYKKLETRYLLSGDVGVQVRGGSLYVTGDREANVVSIATGSDGVVRVSGTNTSINGGGEPFSFYGNLKNVTVRLGNGDDQLTINELTAARKTSIDLGRGNDQLIIDKLTTGRDLKFKGGAGNDSVIVDQMTVQGKTKIDTGRGDDQLLFSGALVANGKSDLKLGSGNDLLAIVPDRTGNSVFVNGKLSINAGSGDDAVTLDQKVNLNQPSRIKGGGGRQDVIDNASTGNSARDKAFEFMGDETITPKITALYNRLEQAGVSVEPLGAVKLTLDPATQLVTVNDRSPTISVLWDQAAQVAVANMRSGPTVASRAYAMLHTAMYDAWSAYVATPVSTGLGDMLQQAAFENTDAHKQHAMSFAAYRVLVDLFPTQVTIFDGLMNQFGYNNNNQSTDTTPAGIGNQMAAKLLATRHADGSNQLGTEAGGTAGVPYSNTTTYAPVNSPGNVIEIDRWTPERVPIDAAAGTEIRIQSYLTPQWGNVIPFGINSSSAVRPIAPESFLLVDGTVDLAAKTITVTGQSPVAIDRNLIGTVINPKFIAQAEEVISFSANLTDQQKLIAEFWEDGGGTSFPPGTWMTFGQFTSARDNHSLDEDAQMFFALGNAVMDAGIATWEAKTFYDYVRPVRAIRELGSLGLIGEFDSTLGGYAINVNQPGQGVQRILASQFLTYQTPGADVSPPFAEYTSGHSSFSAAGATILRLFTGSNSFGASVNFQLGESRFEPGVTPATPLTLAWSTYFAAADEAGVSRKYGGIHFSDGDLRGRVLGSSVGQAAWDRSQFYINGAV